MNNAETHEFYGWMAFNEGFFHEWRDEVANRLLKLSPHECARDDSRANLSIEVFNEMTKRKNKLELGE